MGWPPPPFEQCSKNCTFLTGGFPKYPNSGIELFFIPLSFLGIWEWNHPSRSHSIVIKANSAHPWATVASFPRICERKYTSGGRLPICRWIAIYIRCKSVIGKWLLYEVIQDILTTDPNIDTLCISRLLNDMVHWKISHVHSRRPKILIWYLRSLELGHINFGSTDNTEYGLVPILTLIWGLCEAINGDYAPAPALWLVQKYYYC